MDQFGQALANRHADIPFGEVAKERFVVGGTECAPVGMHGRRGIAGRDRQHRQVIGPGSAQCAEQIEPARARFTQAQGDLTARGRGPAGHEGGAGLAANADEAHVVAGGQGHEHMNKGDNLPLARPNTLRTPRCRSMWSTASAPVMETWEGPS
ncbi:hypothetical protein J2792_002442 [Novosphingobium capsulatum]|uniref:Uncharacterized protein n=1 Tax=Novosphingobium capsulatum TaxID=13688 RepID=A0ABU1MML7_9SPHN|nr:hypothetical protein [Novosphingobium capsulatum]MDR6511570.1 hypothetical protein [Novosphingobium capsulatum]